MLTNIHGGVTDTHGDEQHSGVIWFAEQCMANGAPLESYIIHAESIGDRELATFFRRALAQSRRVRPGAPRGFTRAGARRPSRLAAVVQVIPGVRGRPTRTGDHPHTPPGARRS
jgi:hypothetical protein